MGLLTIGSDLAGKKHTEMRVKRKISIKQTNKMLQGVAGWQAGAHHYISDLARSTKQTKVIQNYCIAMLELIYTEVFYSQPSNQTPNQYEIHHLRSSANFCAGVLRCMRPKKSLET